MANYRYSANNLILAGDRVTFKSKGYKDIYFHAIVRHVYRFGETNIEKWKALIDDGFGLTPRIVAYSRLRFYSA